MKAVGNVDTLKVAADGKKKRGRKPKEVKDTCVINTKVNIIDSFNLSSKKDVECEDTVKNSEVTRDALIVENNIIDEGKDSSKKGKRGRKPKHEYASYHVANNNEDNLLTCSSPQDDEHVIVRLNISNDVLNHDDMMLNVATGSNVEEQPYAYNHDTYNNISNITDILNCQDDNDKKKNKNEKSPKVINVLNEFAEKNKHKEWPINTSISCYWCVHRFENPPFGIPINFKNDSFDVFGCFCSLECAAAYNFSENKSQDEMWERYQLINMMSRKMKLGNTVRCAPSRLSLKMFGGNMDIETFRNVAKSNKLMNVNFPPMTSVTQQLEEINDFEIGNDFKYIPVDDDRINKYKEKIVFKRNKPLIDKNKSLESTMNLKFAS